MKRLCEGLIQWILNLKYRKKVHLAFLAVSLFPLTILGIFCFNQAKSMLLSQAENSLNAMLQQGVSSVKNTLDTYDRLSGYLAFSNDISTSVNREYSSYYDMYETLNLIIDPTFFMTRALTTGVERITLYTSSNLGKHGDTVRPISEISHLPWYQDTIKNVDVLWFFDEEKKSIFSARRILYLDPKRSTDNIIQISVDYDGLFSPLSSISPDTCGVVVTDNNSGKVVFERGINGTKTDTAELLNTPRSDYTVIESDLLPYGWTVAIYQPTNIIYRSAAKILLTVGGVILLCIASVMFVSGLFSKRVVLRIEELRENMRRVEEGELVVTVSSRSHDEVGDLIEGFGHMVKKISHLVREVLTAEITVKESEMKALQAQINPHFLYNSLSLINWRALKLHASDISEMAQLLSTFYRTTLNRGKNITTVQDEWKNVESYMKIQLIMHSGSFIFTSELEGGLENCAMPNLVLQPLIENALVHGVEQKENGQGQIHLNGRRCGETIIFTITDNGPGIPPDILESILELPNQGYGLKNVNERIQLTYGKEYGLDFKNLPDEGCQATLTLPHTLS